MAASGPKDIQMGDFGDEAHDRDPESLEPFTRGYSWYGTWTGQTDSSGMNHGAPSIRSIASHWSVQLFARWSPRTRPAAATQPQPKTTLSDSQTHFLTAILGESPRLESPIQEACEWYIGFLEYKIRDSWIALFRDVLKVANYLTNEPCSQELSVAFSVLRIIIVESSAENLALTNLVDKLYNENLFKYTDEERSHANQLAFAAFGWICGLYPAKLDPNPKRLQIINPWDGDSGRDGKSTRLAATRRRTKTFATYDQSLDTNDQPLHNLLGRFGKIVPQRTRSLIPGQSTPQHMAPTRRDEQSIEMSLLCYRTLDKVASIKIEWVDSLSLHLEFNSSTKVLRLFRLPSLCLIMCSCERSPLARLFYDADKSSRYFLEVDVEDNIDPREFYREVLSSFRLIFGQDNASHNDFKKWIEKGNPLPEEYHDALLPVLCCQSWQSTAAQSIYEFIDVEDPSTHYSPAEDFPYLEKRLLEIQKYVRGQKPNTFWAIWYDKRDPAEWWTFWAVIIIGGVTVAITLLLGGLQLIVGILQVQYAREQLSQQLRQNVPPGG